MTRRKKELDEKNSRYGNKAGKVGRKIEEGRKAERQRRKIEKKRKNGRREEE